MPKHIVTIARYTLLEAVGNRLLWLALLLLVSAFGLAEFVGDLALTEQREIQVAILSSLLRVSCMVVLSLLVVTSILRELQDKSLELILSLDISRGSYFFGKLLGFSLIAAILVILSGLLLMLYAQGASVLVWSLSLFCEALIVIALCLVMLFTFRQIPAALSVVFLFYAMARSMASIQLIADNPIMRFQGLGQQFINGFVDLLAWLLPGLHRFARSEWLVYNNGSIDELIAIVAQTGIYLVLLSGVALFDFYRKNFA